MNSSQTEPQDTGTASDRAGDDPAMQAKSTPELTPQQRRLRESRGAVGIYRELMVGSAAWSSLLGFELYQLLCAATPGIPGFALRTIAARWLFASFGKGSAIGRSVQLRQAGNISIGRRVMIDDYAALDVRSSGSSETSDGGRIIIEDDAFIGKYTIIAAKGAQITLRAGANISSHCRLASETSIEIGESCLVAAYSYIGPGNHQRDEHGRPVIGAEMEKRGGVKIGAHSWIGTRATILDGVTIGERAVIGAHSLVREDVPAGAVVAGSPAKIIG